MASRITSLTPACGYSPGGIQNVRVLDWADFGGYGFNGLYDTCLVTALERSSDFADVQAKAAKYTGPLTGKIVTHTLDTFIESLDADLTAQIHLASKRRYVVVFDGMNGKPYTFGYEAGATVNYNGQTEGANGYLVSFVAPSIYPLFEMTPEALAGTSPVINWLPDFTTGAYCQIEL